MKSTEMILDITDKFGEDQKPELTKALKKFRIQVKQEILYRQRRGLFYANQLYKKEIKPGQKNFSINQREKSPSDGDQFGRN